MRDLRECSGPWKGLWTQHEVRGTMSMRLNINEWRIEGGGRDQDGGFTISGAWDPSTNRVVLHKRYPLLRVKYDGVWNGSYIAGKSSIGFAPFLDQGLFELWPENEETEVQEFTQELELVIA